MMSIEGPANASPGDPPPAPAWGFSGQVVTSVRTRDQAEATIRFFGFIRDVILDSPRRGTTTAAARPSITPEDSRQWAAGEFSGDAKANAIMRALRVIALDADGRADTLLALDAHTAYLRGRFRLPEPV
jgi:hypothetical protein